MSDFKPLNPTGYENYGMWDAAPGFEIRAYTSPKAEPLVKDLALETAQTEAKVVAGYIYGHFECIEAGVKEALHDMNYAHTWLAYYHDEDLASFLLVQVDELQWFLLHKDEANKIQEGLDLGLGEIHLDWVTLYFQDEVDIQISNEGE